MHVSSLYSPVVPFEADPSYPDIPDQETPTEPGDFGQAGFPRIAETDEATSPPTPHPPAQPPAQEQSPQEQPAQVDSFSYTELGNADRFVAQHGKDVLYVAKEREWRHWDARRWVRDETEHVWELAKHTARHIADDADGEDADLARWAKCSQSRRGVGNMLALARSDRRIAARSADFDLHAHLLNFENGTLDLKTGVLRPHDRGDFLTKLVPSPYDPEATCPVFEDFLDTAFKGDREMVAYLRRALGHSLLGGNPEQVFFILHGSGANGKSVLVNAVLDALGSDYAMQMCADSLLRDSPQNGMLRSDLAHLKGARLAVAAETDEAKRLNTSLVKQLSGGDIMRARFLYGREFEFRPECTIFLCTNHRPVIDESSHAIWRRIHLIPFSVVIPDDEQEKTLSDKLAAESEGILRWLVDGLRDYQQAGLCPPATVTNAVDLYREEADQIAQFLEDMCEKDPEGTVGSARLYQQYRKWAKEQGNARLNNKQFPPRMEAHGFKKRRCSSGILWFGLRLRTASDEKDSADGPGEPNSGPQHDRRSPVGWSTQGSQGKRCLAENTAS